MEERRARSLGRLPPDRSTPAGSHAAARAVSAPSANRPKVRRRSKSAPNDRRRHRTVPSRKAHQRNDADIARPDPLTTSSRTAGGGGGARCGLADGADGAKASVPPLMPKPSPKRKLQMKLELDLAHVDSRDVVRNRKPAVRPAQADTPFGQAGNLDKWHQEQMRLTLAMSSVYDTT